MNKQYKMKTVSGELIDTYKIKRILRYFFAQLYWNKSEILDEMDGFLEKYKLLKPIKEVVENLSD